MTVLRRSSLSAMTAANAPKSRSGASRTRMTPEIAAPCVATDWLAVSCCARAVLASNPSQSPRLEKVIAAHMRRNTGMRKRASSVFSRRGRASARAGSLVATRLSGRRRGRSGAGELVDAAAHDADLGAAEPAERDVVDGPQPPGRAIEVEDGQRERDGRVLLH